MVMFLKTLAAGWVLNTHSLTWRQVPKFLTEFWDAPLHRSLSDTVTGSVLSWVPYMSDHNTDRGSRDQSFSVPILSWKLMGK